MLLLSESQPGGRYAVQSVYERDRKLGEFLEKLGIRPGAEIAVQQRNYDDTLSLVTPAGKVSLGRTAAEKVWVAPAGEINSSRQKRINHGLVNPIYFS